MNDTSLEIAALGSRMEELGLSFMASGLESFLADEARSQSTLLASVRALMDLEYVARKERMTRTRLKLSGMPQYKSLEEFDLSWLKGGLPRERFEELKSLAFVERKENVLLLGPSGSARHTFCWAWGTRRACRATPRTTSAAATRWRRCYGPKNRGG